MADSGNTYDIVSELSEYVTDVDAAIARESVRAVGRIPEIKEKGLGV